MEQRRFLVFSLVMMTLWLGWLTAGPVVFPDLFPVVPVEEVAQPDGDKQLGNAEKPTVGEVAALPGDKQAPGDEKPAKPEAPAKPEQALPAHATKSVTLGSLTQESGYGLQVELSSVGAAVRSATLNDPRYVVAENLEGIAPLPQLQIVGTKNKQLGSEVHRPLGHTVHRLASDQ